MIEARPNTSPKNARHARHVGSTVIARSPCDEAIQGRRYVWRRGAVDGSAVAPGLLRRFAPRNDEPKLGAHAKSA